MEQWFRNALFVTAVMNFGGALLLVPPFRLGREFFGLPTPTHDFYLWIIAIWIAAFGAAYLALALSKRQEKIFIAVAAVGKLSFSLLLIFYWLNGEIPALTAFAGCADLFFGGLFVYWLIKHSTEKS